MSCEKPGKAEAGPAADFATKYKPATGSTLTKPAPPGAQMLVQANEVRYDYNNLLVSAVGNVQIYYNGATIEADRVVYDQATKRLRAEGARLTEANGKVTVGQVIDLTNYYRDGFVDSLGLETVAPRHAPRQPQRRPLLRQP